MAPRLLTHVIPLLVFPFLSFVGIKVVFDLCLNQNGVQAKINEICNPTFGLASHPLRLPYTNIPVVDETLCIMGTFFQDVLDPPTVLCSWRCSFRSRCFPSSLMSKPLARNRLSSFVSLLLSASYPNSHLWPAPCPFTPSYSSITGTASRRPSHTTDSNINQANAEALLFALLAGYVVPTLCITVYNDPKARYAGVSRYIDSGHRTVMAMFGLLFAASAAAHAAYVWPLLGDWEVLKTTFPSFGMSLLDPAATSLAEPVMALLKWDFILGSGGIILGDAVDGKWCRSSSVVSFSGTLFRSSSLDLGQPSLAC
ncbi:hypothetical protein BU15DRAFT_65393 [Melanogaster broomeanus]|nr:hypothetical protein BU15DRAFT_65393 [Melanogaster broomeanus]